MNSATNSTAGGPVIGISSPAGPAKWAIFEKVVTLMPMDVIGRVLAAGCVPVLLPPVPGVERAVDRLDGLLLPGGLDIDPEHYGAERHPRARVDRGGRDGAELALAAAALAAGLPVLGVCRGLQILNVARGGTLHQYLPETLGHAGHNPNSADFGQQEVRTEPGSRIAKILGETATVPCLHDQAIDRLGAGVRATAWAADGTVEAAELEDHPFAVAVQWHAEESADDSLFRALAEAARTR